MYKKRVNMKTVIIIFLLLIGCENYNINSVSYNTEDVQIVQKTRITVNNRAAIAIKINSTINSFTLIAKAKRNQVDLQIIERKYSGTAISDTLIFNTIIYQSQIDFYTFAIKK